MSNFTDELTALTNLSFDCGAWQQETHDEPYDHYFAASTEAREKVVAQYAKLRQALAKIESLCGSPDSERMAQREDIYTIARSALEDL